MLEQSFEIIFGVANKRTIAWATAQAFTDEGARLAFNFDLVSFAVGVTSLGVSFLTLWLSFHFKSEADRVNEKTQRLLDEIKSDAEVLARFGINELERYGGTARSLILRKGTLERKK